MPSSQALPSCPNLIAPSLFRRLACLLYEALLLAGIIFVVGLLLGVVGMAIGIPVPPSVLQALLLIALGVYFCYFWSHGQTLAMRTWRIRVVDQHGRPLTRIRALTRYTFSWLWILPPLAAVAPFHLPWAEIMVLTLGWVLVWSLLSRFHPQKQFLHDWFAGTRLVNDAQP